MASIRRSIPPTCGLCSQLYVDPRLLDCLHSFCQKCLKEKLSSQSKSILCPVCAVETCVQDGQLDQLPEDLRKRYESEVAMFESKLKNECNSGCDRCLDNEANTTCTFCVDCCENLCDLCVCDHKRARKTIHHKLVNRKLKSDEDEIDFAGESAISCFVRGKPIFCDFHKDEKLKFYCKTCSRLVCRDCITLRHSEHTFNIIDTVVGPVREKFTSSLESVHSALEKIEKIVSTGDRVIQDHKENDKSVRDEICSAFEKVQLELLKRKEELLELSSQISSNNLSPTFTSQYDCAVLLRKDLGRLCELISNATSTYSTEQLLSLEQPVSSRLESLLKQSVTFPTNIFNGEAVAPIYTSLDPSNLLSAISRFGLVTAGCCPQQCTLALQIPRAVVGKTRRMIVTARNANGQKCPLGGDDIRGVVCSSAEGTTFPVTTTDKGNGTYELCFTPQAVGDYELSVTAHYVLIRGSPFNLYVRKYRDYRSLSSYKACINTTSSPWCVTVSIDKVYVAEGGRKGSIVVYDSSGSNLQTIGMPASTKRRLPEISSPSGIAVNGDTLFVSEFFDNQILQLSMFGEVISKFGSKGSKDGQFDGPRGLLRDQINNKLYVSDSGNDRISVFNLTDNSFSHNIVGEALKGTSLENPWESAFDPSGNLHVACYNSHCVKVYTPEGEYVTQYGRRVLTCPAGIVIDEEGCSFVSEFGGVSYRLLIFDPQYKLLHSVQNFSSPAGLAMDRDGHVYVADHGNCRVLKY